MDENEIYRDALGRFRADQEKCQQELTRQRRETEIEMLSNAKDQREYDELRELLPEAIDEEEAKHVPLEDLSGSAYVRVRNRG